jgi:succinate-acetate transporter protein
MNLIQSNSGSYYYFGGLLLVLGGFLEFILGNTFPSVVFTSYRAFFLLLLLPCNRFIMLTDLMLRLEQVKLQVLTPLASLVVCILPHLHCRPIICLPHSISAPMSSS